MLAYLAAYVSSAAVFVAGDFVWLTFAGPRLYRPVLGPLLADKVDAAAAIAFYLLYLAGVLLLAIVPGLKSGLWRTTGLRGLVLGLVAYGTYDLTNQATLRVWAVQLTAADMLWGAGLTTLAASAGWLAGRRVG